MKVAAILASIALIFSTLSLVRSCVVTLDRIEESCTAQGGTELRTPSGTGCFKVERLEYRK